jgi:fructokinase
MRLLAGSARAVCFGSLAQRSAVSRRAIRRFVSLMSAPALKVFDINLRQSFYSRAVIHDLLGLSNVFKLNDEELLVIAEMLSIRGKEDAVVRSLMRRYKLGVVAVTRGAAGAVLYCRQGSFMARAPMVKIIDTVGAGDSFTAALAVGLVNHVKMAKVVELANRLAAYVCGKHGATPVLSEVMRKALAPLCRPAAGK